MAAAGCSMTGAQIHVRDQFRRAKDLAEVQALITTALQAKGRAVLQKNRTSEGASNCRRAGGVSGRAETA